MSTVLNTVPALEVKRRGVRAIVEKLDRGPVHVLQHDRPAFVALAEGDFQQLIEDLTEAQISASLRDLEAGRVRCGTAADIIAELTE